jgi:aspartate racemase
MKTIGLLGGMSWESTSAYYRIINETVREKMGGFHSAKCILHSVDFEEIEQMQTAGRWEEAGRVLSSAARSIELAGADFFLICTNTMHRLAPEIQAAVSIPLLHIADATAASVRKKNIRRVGLLGTRYTMEEAFYRKRLESPHGIQVIIPSEPDRTTVHEVIYKELCMGKILEKSGKRFREIIGNLVDEGAEGIVLGCTEIGLLVRPDKSPVPIFDTTEIHAAAAVEKALGPG